MKTKRFIVEVMFAGFAVAASGVAGASTWTMYDSDPLTAATSVGSPLTVDTKNGGTATVYYNPEADVAYAYNNNFTPQNSTALLAEIKTLFGDSGQTYVSQCDSTSGGCTGATVTNTGGGWFQYVSSGFNFLAVHLGGGEIIFKWDSLITTFNIKANGLSDFRAYKDISQVPLPGAAWLFGSALVGFMAFASRRKI